MIDEVLYQHRAEQLTPLVLIAALAFVLQHGLNSLRIILNNTFEQRVIFDLRSDLYSHIQMLPLRWFDNRATGDLMTRILEDVNSVERMLIDGIEQGGAAVRALSNFPMGHWRCSVGHDGRGVARSKKAIRAGLGRDGRRP